MAYYHSGMTSTSKAVGGDLSYSNDLSYAWPPFWAQMAADNFRLQMTSPALGGDSLSFFLNYIELESQNFPNAKIIFADQDLLNFLDHTAGLDGVDRSIVNSIFFTTSKSSIQKIGNLSIPQMACVLDDGVKKQVSLNINSDFQDFKIFVSLFDESAGAGIIYQSQYFNKGQIAIEVTAPALSGFSVLEFTSKPFLQKQATLNLFEENYLSNIYYTCTTAPKEMLGFFAFDMQKFLSVYAAFPGLAEAIPAWASYVLKAQVYLKKLKEPRSQVVVSTVAADCSLANVKVINSSGKLFFDFSIRDVSKLSEYNLELRMLFDDKTKKAAENYLTQIENNRQDRDAVATAVSAFYTNQAVPLEYDALINSSAPLEDLEYQNLLASFVDEISSKLGTYKTKIVKNNKASTALTYPKFNYPKIPLTSFDFSFLQRVKIQSEISLNLPLGSSAGYNLKASSGLNFQAATQGKDSLTKLDIKLFDLTSTLQLIPIFKIDIIKEVTDKLRKDINTDVSCGDEDEIQNILTTITSLPKITSLTTVKTQKYEFEYLASLNDTVSGFVWEALTDGVIAELVGGSAILVRVKGHSEYYNGIFYLLSDGGF